MGVVTYLPRLLPLWLLSQRSLPQTVVAWLRHVPVAMLSALLFPSIVLVGEDLVLYPSNIFLWAAIPTFLVAWRTRNLFASVVVGMLVVAAARLLFPQ
jgi:branched-subunit amino acid transport protein